MRSIVRLTSVQLAAILLVLASGALQAQLEPRSSGLSLAETLAQQPEPLSLDKAFPYFVSSISPGRYRVTWEPAPGHYLYQHAFAFAQQNGSEGEELEVTYTLPDGLEKTDQFFGDIVAYYEPVSVEIELGTVPGPDAALIIEYQGCADWGFCYPPQKASFPLLP